MKALKYHHFQSAGGSIPYVRMGKGPVLFLLIGFHSDVERFKYIIAYFAQHFDVIVPEYPGMGCEATLGDLPYTTESYAKVYLEMIKSLGITSYMLGGLCYGGIISIRMMQLGAKPKKLILIETFTAGSQIKPYWYQKPLVPIVDIAAKSTALRKLFHRIIKSEKLLSYYFRFVFRGDPHIDEVVKYQVHLTSMVNPDAYLDASYELLHFSLFKSKDTWNVPTLSLFFTNDPQLDTRTALVEIERHFPKNTTTYIEYDQHVPNGPMSEAQVKHTFGPVASTLFQKIMS